MVTAATTFKIAQPTRHVDALRPWPENPRDEIDPEDPAIRDMADSIARLGILEPLIITPDNFVIAGHRRRVATRVAAKKYDRPDLMIVPVIVREVAPEAILELMLHENMQRQSLTLLEEARAMYKIMERKKLTVADLAREISVSAKDVGLRLSILKCEPPVQALFAAEQLPLSAAPWLCRIPNADRQIHYAGLVARRQVTITKLKEIATAPLAPASTPKQMESETADDIPAARPRQSLKSLGLAEHRPPTRAEAIASLRRAIAEQKKSITLFNFQSVVESLCCACGMEGQSEICRSCPFPRIILGVAGRAN
jgi:ParB family transcriptional regulator, chromosome partitioning protein